jgi:CP family cyanate transporter-like MFS transporter
MVPAPSKTPTISNSEGQVKQPWAGRIYLLAGIVLLGLSLRHAVTAVAPLLATIGGDIGMGTSGATILGMLPTLAFGIAGFFTPAVIRKVGLPQMAVLALILGALGTLIRVFASDQMLFIAFGGIALLGMGMGNIVGPPLVKRYFPDRQAAAMSLLVLMTQAGATIPAMLAVPLENAGGWRIAVGCWAGLMVVAALPWIVAMIHGKREETQQTAHTTANGISYGLSALIKNKVSMGAALFYSMAALNTYAILAWLPTILAAQGHSEAQAATMYSVYTFMTLPMAFVTPMVASKLKNPLPLGVFLSIVAAIGYCGLLFAPSSTAIAWAVIAGIGGGAFPFAMTMFNLRTRSAAGSAAITGFALGCGYAIGTTGPLLGGLLSTMTGSWTVPLLVFAATSVPMAYGAFLLTKSGQYEDRATG